MKLAARLDRLEVSLLIGVDLSAASSLSNCTKWQGCSSCSLGAAYSRAACSELGWPLNR